MFFATLNHPNGGVVPLMDAEGEQVATFNTVKEAEDAIKTSTLGHHYGGRVFNHDQPISWT